MAKIDTQFKKGSTPWNKGIKMPNFHPIGMSGKKLTKEHKEKISIKMQKEKHPMWKGGLPKCLDCGKKLSNYTNKRCPKHSVTGENNGKYIKDRTQLVKSEKKHLDSNYKIWMKAVKDRDNWKCKIADENCKGRLEAHHILNWKEYTELRYQLNNGITLCQAHHPRGRAEEKLMSPYFKELLTSKV